jgi:ATP-dependent DNA helicase RecQ
MPRPAIVYTTEVNDARELYRIVAEEHGFQRVGCFHGDTPSEDRLRLLSEWQNDKIDLMVATSAFGLGVDKNDVRTVVHACAPESVDRYYQEVGRGGRDGASASCVFLPSSRDWHIAKRLTPRLIGDKKLRLRWNAMWQQRQSVSDAERNLFDLPLDVKHAELYGARSYDKNIQWNKRLLLLLVRAGHLRIVGAPWREHASAYEGAFSHWVRVELRFNPLDDVARLIHTQRDKELQGSARALKQISSYVTTGIPICRVLQRQYSYEAQRACGSCHACRHGQANPASCPALIGPTLTKTTPSVALVLGAPDFTTINGRNDVIDLIRRVVQKMWIKRFLCTVAEREMVTSCFRDAFGTKDRILYRIDSVDSEVSVGITPEETLICVHVGGYSAALEAANQFGKAVIHWVAHRHVVLDGNGRLPLIAGGAAHYSSVEQWLSAANA